ncbi:MAG: hypothetical protein ACRENK_14395 [Gemmatimonadaceae bacterium]
MTLERGRVVGATIGLHQLDARQVRQDGASLQLVDRATVLSLRMTPDGGIEWKARKPVVPHT